MSHELISEANQISKLKEGSQEALALLFAQYTPRLISCPNSFNFL